MENEFIFTSGYGKRLTFNESNQLLKDKKPNLLKLSPGLRDGEKGYFCDSCSPRQSSRSSSLSGPPKTDG